jgi:hypothetical protein
MLVRKGDTDGTTKQSNKSVGKFFQNFHGANKNIPHDVVCILSLLLRLVWHRAIDESRT